MPFTDQFVEIDGCKLHLRRGGSGRPLVFLPGASGEPAVLPFMEKLATRFDVLVPDHPGYGQSDEPEWLENIHDVAYFYLDFLAQLKLERAVIVGSSMGGWMAMEMAVRNTSRIASLVLVSPAGVRCALSVRYANGARQKGLAPQAATNGRASWRWQVGLGTAVGRARVRETGRGPGG